MVRAFQFLWCCCLWLGILAPASAANAASAEPEAVPARTKPAVAADDCTTAGCHDSLKQRKVLHGPVAQGKCLDCHAYDDVDQHKFTIPAGPDEGCTVVCHDMKQRKVVHAAVHDRTCTVCHDPHGSDHPKLLVADPGKGLCAKCHDKESTTLAMSPKPHAQCADCHDPHSTTEAKLLKDQPWKLCAGCHKDAVASPVQARSVHAPERDTCLACHTPHGSSLKHQLKQDVPGLCLSCHDDLKRSLAISPVVHGAVSQEGGCSSCHLPHFSKLPALQRQTQPQQCLSCHDRPVRAADGRTLPNMAALLNENPEQHGPIRLGACTACHQPHAAREAQLLTAEYPPEFYAPFKVERYKLCFGCHSPDLALSPKAAGVTGFADGDRNLHWLHVNQEKGRTCRACHEVHASRQPFHIRESVPFGPGGWNLSIRFQQTPTGGTCGPGCHLEKSYDHGQRPRTVPFAASVPKSLVPAAAPPAPIAPTTHPVTLTGEGMYPVPPPPFTPGVFPCSGCHDPNLPVNAERRALKKPHEDIQLHHDEEHRWCLDCHNAENRDVLRTAGGAPISFAESYRLCGQCHGVQYRDWKGGIHGKRTGQWNGRREYLLCVHCHNPHSPKFKPLMPLPPPHRPGEARAHEEAP